MFSKLATTAFIGLASTSLVAAAPAGWYQNSDSWSYGKGSGTPSYQPPANAPSYSSPPFPTETKADGNKFKYELSNNFPNPSSAETLAIEQAAGGTLPNGPPPPSIQPDSLTSLRLIAFNELAEVAFFTELLQNITNNVPGYSTGAFEKAALIEIIETVQAQEELHALNANGALAHFNAGPILPCEYVFPVTNLHDAIALANTFTDLVLGTLQDVQTLFGQDGDAGLIRGVGAVIGQEGEQNGFYRLFQGKRPSAQPFLTASARAFAFSALQSFVVPGSCPNENTIALPIFAPLNVLTPPGPSSQNVKFSFTVPTNTSTNYATDELSLVLINGQNLPIVETLQNRSFQNGVLTFEAAFPFEQDLLFGLTIAAVTQGSGPFASVDAVAAATIAGPGLIEVD